MYNLIICNLEPCKNDYIQLGKRLHFKKLHTLFNSKMVIYIIYILMQIRLMKQTCIYMYPHSTILLETPPLLCLMRKLGIYRHLSYNLVCPLVI